MRALSRRSIRGSIAALLLIALGGIVMATTAAAADQAIWIEGEQPTGGVALPWNANPPSHPEYLSGGQWLSLMVPAGDVAKTIPADGLTISWSFSAPSAGHYQVWERYGFESIRSPWQWKIDDQAWQAVKPSGQQPFTDLMDPGFWSELAWTQLGEADLTAGTHAIRLKIDRDTDKDGKPKATNHVVDCFCLSKTAFIPNGKTPPGGAWQSDADRAVAASGGFTMPGPAADGARTSLDLNGTWQITRDDEWAPADRTGIDTALPAPETCFWSAIPVPGDKYHVRPDLDLCHRFVYRTTIDVPAALAGRAFIIHFPSINMIASVFVNGSACGGTKAMLADWTCDVTKAIKPGSKNELAVIIKDTYYAFSPEKGNRPWCAYALTPPDWVTRNWFTPAMDFPVASHPEAGILETPVISACGAVYAQDIFAQPSVTTKSLKVDVTVVNPFPDAANATLRLEVQDVAGGAVVKTFAAQPVALTGSEQTVVTLTEPWADAKLWWPEEPNLYHMVAHLDVAGKASDRSSITFGFREWGWNSSQFTLNGVPWHFHADITEVPGGPDANLAMLHDHSQNIIRLWGGMWGLGPHAVLDYCDQHGMVVRYTGIFDGEGANYMGGLNDQKLFDNWYPQLKAWVISERNHPSLLIWSIENEITFINSRNLGLSKTVEPMVAAGGKVVMQTDPTRPAMVDGGRALITEDMPVNGCHYDEAAWREYPDEAYTYALADVSDKINYNGWGKSIWRMVPDRPIFHGETYFLMGNRPSDLAQMGGEEAFIGWSGAKHGAGLLAKMMSEGNRWHQTAAFHFWLGEDSVDPYYNSWKPVCVLAREWNSTFASGATVTRTLKIFNDTHYSDPIDMAWAVTVAGTAVAGGKKTYQVAPGMNQDESISFQLPIVSERTTGELVLTCSRGGKEVFRDVKPIAVIDTHGVKKGMVLAGPIAVIDPSHVVIDHLTRRGLAFQEFTDPDQIPAGAYLVIVGPDALTPRSATGTQWLSVAARGGRVLVLDQANPLQAAAIPADMTVNPVQGRIAFSENLLHPAFNSLAQSDFLCWSGDHIDYRNPYTKPTRGAISLADCDQDLNDTCLAECRVNDGLMVLSQLLVGSKLASDPVASRMFDNLVAYCESYQPVRKGTSLVLDGDSPRGKAISGSGLVYDKQSDPLAAISGRDEIAVVDGSAANLKLLAAHLAEVQSYTRKGGWLFLWGVTPDGLADYNKIVGVEHIMRPFKRERVTLPAVRDPELTGITMSDVVMDTGQAVTAWSGQRFASSDSYSYVVDYDDIAPFITYPSWQYFNPGQATPSPDHVPDNLTNGFTTADGWQFIFQLAAKAPFLEWDMTLPRPETLTQLDIIPNALYRSLTRIEWTVNDDTAHLIPIPLEPKATLQSIALPPVVASKIHVNLAAWDLKACPEVIGIDNWWIRVKRSPEFYAKVKPLMNIGALVKYPQGKGGILLCELNIPEHEQNPENGPKRKNLIASLLRNLGAVYSGGKVIVAGANLTYEPVPFNELCNQFLTKDKGWFSDLPNDLGSLPVGANVFSGVSYQIRDFKTSPLPCAISLSGPGEKTPLPDTVSGIVVGKKADALFFLHTWRQTAGWTAPKDGDRTPPAAWIYTVHYADGQSVAVPVGVDDGVSNWLQKDPRGLPAAVVAWAAPCGTDTQAVVYQMQWTNPRPAVAIATIDVGYDPKVGNHYGVPVVLAISAAHQ